MFHSRRLLFGTVATAVFVGIFLYQVDFEEMWKAFGGANYLYLVPALGAYGAAVFFRTVRWQYLLQSLGKPTLSTLTRVLIVGYMANNLLPIRLGEIVRSYYLGTKTGISKTGGFATIVVERVFDGLVLLAFLAGVSLSLPLVDTLGDLGARVGLSWGWLAIGMSLPFVATLALLLAFVNRSTLVEKILSRVLPPTLKRPVHELIVRFIEGLGSVSSSEKLLLALLLSLPVWISEALMYLLIGFGFGLGHYFTEAGQFVATILVVTATANLALAVPSSQGGVGPFEFFTHATLVLLGVTTGPASAYAIVLHATLLVPITVVGLVLLSLDNLPLVRLLRHSHHDTLISDSAGRSLEIQEEKNL